MLVSKLHKGQINIHAWVYIIQTGEVFVYSQERCSIQAEHEASQIYEMPKQKAEPSPDLNGKGTASLQS
ncbi:hypothetical protein [Argonema galeatum]|uniref:hypothetical protein n=1 Tax=Argonema galeatum TaxID=2942762 RepID=UPI002012609D|nr:hypothetical protein [Argonema galeatum]MCL1467880.1 hypothetical protein [Argonema galeatum A003/A1]